MDLITNRLQAYLNRKTRKNKELMKVWAKRFRRKSAYLLPILTLFCYQKFNINLKMSQWYKSPTGAIVLDYVHSSNSHENYPTITFKIPQIFRFYVELILPFASFEHIETIITTCREYKNSEIYFTNIYPSREATDFAIYDDSEQYWFTLQIQDQDLINSGRSARNALKNQLLRDMFVNYGIYINLEYNCTKCNSEQPAAKICKNCGYIFYQKFKF